MANKPTHYLKLITGEGKAKFTPICALWPSKKDPNNLTGEIPEGMTITGRIGIFPINEGDNVFDGSSPL